MGCARRGRNCNKWGTHSDKMLGPHERQLFVLAYPDLPVPFRPIQDVPPGIPAGRWSIAKAHCSLRLAHLSLGDKGYDADAILADLDARGVVAIIPPKRNRTVQRELDGHIYALRNLVERCFSKLKHSRRLATRYDKTADSYLGFILVASIRLWVRHFVNMT